MTKKILVDDQFIKTVVTNDTITTYDKQFNFYTIFNSKTGNYVKSGIIGPDGKDTGVDPFQSSYPHLIDCGCMAVCHAAKICKQGGIDCYQHGSNHFNKDMDLDTVKSLIDQCRGKTYEIAFGGKGDPNTHENFEEIFSYARENYIAPNYTTSGINLTDKQIEVTKALCGACAISWQRQPHTISALNRLIEAKVTTNIHYVLSNQTIKELIDLIKGDKFPKGINALIILNYKNIGLGDISKVIKGTEPELKELFELLDTKLPFKIGMDSCSCQFIGKFMKNVNSCSVSSCDSGCFSAYLAPNNVLCPCSFDAKQTYGVDLNKSTLVDAWNSSQFKAFRTKQQYGLDCGKCKTCKHHIDVCKPCVLVPDINICSRGN
jgi:hypothetical protein